MSDSDLVLLVSSLQQTVHQLSVAVDLLTLRVSDLELHSNRTTSSSEGWELIEPEQQVLGGLSGRRINLEDGPPELPLPLESLASALTDIGGGRIARARAAFRAGYWAQLAVSTFTEYEAAENSALTFSHWIVLRGSGTLSAFRVTRKQDLNRLLRNHRAGRLGLSPVVQGFASLAELRIFCGGAGIGLPPLVKWTSN